MKALDTIDQSVFTDKWCNSEVCGGSYMLVAGLIGTHGQPDIFCYWLTVVLLQHTVRVKLALVAYTTALIVARLLFENCMLIAGELLSVS